MSKLRFGVIYQNEEKNIICVINIQGQIQHNLYTYLQQAPMNVKSKLAVRKTTVENYLGVSSTRMFFFLNRSTIFFTISMHQIFK